MPSGTAERTSETYTDLCRLGREHATLASVSALLGWDQETYMPPAGAETRSEQAALISALKHERLTSDQFADALAACEADGSVVGESDSAMASAVRAFRRDHDRARKIPTELVAELARVGSQAQEVWKEARVSNDFSKFAPWLEKMFGLTNQKAECIGFPDDGELYDALLDEFEPEAKASEIERVFAPLGDELSALIAEVNSNGTAPDDAPLNLSIKEEQQHAFGRFVLRSIGFKFDAGRLDTTTHPFCSGVAPGDTRLTTRYRDERFTDALYGSMHEAGHGMYEQNLPKGEHFGSPLGESISLGIHESQSRMWENFVGRSRQFWQWVLPHAKTTLGDELHPFNVDQMYHAVNTATPSLIRVEADEATYNLHVMLRFEIERAIVRGDLPVEDLPAYWNKRFKELIGMDVPDDRRGCLQDVHWSFGLIGYFPTYTLGNLYAAQIWETMQKQIPGMIDGMARGEFEPILAWLNTNIHAHGRRYSATELCQRLTGESLSQEPLLRHLRSRLGDGYGL